MTDGMEHTLEYVVSGMLFCMAIAMLLWMHGAFIKQAKMIGHTPERMILYEQEG